MGQMRIIKYRNDTKSMRKSFETRQTFVEPSLHLLLRQFYSTRTLSDTVRCLVTKSFIPMSPRLWVEILLSSQLIRFFFSVFLFILLISQVADTNTTRNVQKQDRSMILINLFLWKCNKVNEGQRVTFLISLLNVLYFWTPWAGMKRRGRFLAKSTLKYVRI